ncbi:MAG: acyl-CoA dehydrogenase family protein, partial [Microvirgula sp.]
MTVSSVSRRRRRPATPTDSASRADDGQVLDVARQLALRLQEGGADALAQFQASGLGGVAVPKAYGGGGVGSGTLAQLIRLLAVGDPALARMAHSHYAVLEVLRATGSEPQKQVFFRRALEGERFAAALAETGVDEVCRIETRIHCVDGHYRIDGRKCDAGGAAQADWVALSVRSGDGN